MKGRICLVTGANTGIGLETARELARQGAVVVMASRDVERGEAAVADVRQSTGSDTVELLHLDLASIASIRAAAATFLSRHARLHVLINNAGLVLSDRRETEDGFEMTFGVNHLGGFLLTHLLLDTLKASAPARVVNLASDAHRISSGLPFDDLQRTGGYAGLKVYGDSKLANILFTRELARRLEGSGVVTNAVHPGAVRSSFGADGDAAWYITAFYSLGRWFVLTPAQGARTSLHVATDPALATVSGGYFARSRPKKPNAAAQDDAAAARLWQVSEELLGLSPTPSN